MVNKNVKNSTDALVEEFCNKNFTYISSKDAFSTSDIEDLKLKFKYIPELDQNGKIIKIHGLFENHVVLGNKIINKKSPCFFIAEIGNNHNGDMNLAKKLVDLAKLVVKLINISVILTNMLVRLTNVLVKLWIIHVLPPNSIC